MLAFVVSAPGGLARPANMVMPGREADPVADEPSAEPPAPPSVDDGVKSAVRALLRFGGYKPSGRGRPASESLAKAVEDGRWPTIHPLVDECNRLSLRTGIPISVVDAGLLRAPLTIRLGQPGESYVFNPSGQVLEIKGLLVLADAEGPTGSPVKDAQRSKVSETTSSFLILTWGTTAALDANQTLAEGVQSWCAQRGLDCRRLDVVAGDSSAPAN